MLAPAPTLSLTLSNVEKSVIHHSFFCLLDWLLTENIIAYADYEDWRYGKLSTLDNKISIDTKTLDQLFSDTEQHTKSLGLCNDPQDYYGWHSDALNPLRAANNKNTHQQLTQHWLRPQDLPQLDLFMDNSAVIAENMLCDALGGRQWTQAKQQLAQLSGINPNHQRLGRYQDILNYGEHMHAMDTIAATDIAGEFYGLQQEVCPLAKEILGNCARDYLGFAWRRIADNLSDSDFDPAQPKIHRSYALAQIPDWRAVEESLCHDPQCYLHPQLLTTLTISYSMQNQAAQALLLGCLLAENHVDYFEENITTFRDQPIFVLWESFWELNDGWPSTFFSAFVLLKQPGLIHHQQECEQLTNRASQAMINLLHSRLSKENEIPAREQLQAVSPALLRLYLELREH